MLDTNPMVIANSIAALVEIQKGDYSSIVDRHSLSRVLSSLDACTECARTIPTIYTSDKLLGGARSQYLTVWPSISVQILLRPKKYSMLYYPSFSTSTTL